MGKKMHTEDEVSSERTADLGITDLLALDTEGDNENYYVVHKRYFKKTSPFVLLVVLPKHVAQK